MSARTPARADGRRTDTRARLLQTAAGAFAAAGFEAVTLTDIARSVGVTPGAVFKHFPNKRAIYEAVLESAVVGFAGPAAALIARGDAPRATLLSVCELYWDHCARNPHAAALVLWECRSAENEHVRRLQVNNVYLLEFLRGVIRKGQSAGEIGEIDPDFFVFWIASTCATFFAAPGLRLHLWDGVDGARTQAAARAAFVATLERSLAPSTANRGKR